MLFGDNLTVINIYDSKNNSDFKKLVINQNHIFYCSIISCQT